MWSVYFLRNEAGRTYVGCTGRDPKRRLAEHNLGLNRWTKAHRPWTLAHYESFGDKSEALRRERFYKTGRGREMRDEIIQKYDTGA